MTDPNPFTMCPTCQGERQVYRIVHYAGPPRYSQSGWTPCGTCQGEGKIPLEQLNRLDIAERRRQDRVDRKVSLRDEAAALGITPRELGDREHGRAPWPEES